MENTEIFKEIKIIFSRLIDDKLELMPTTTSREVKKWDSLNHVMFVTEIEKKFGIRFDLFEMLEMRTISDLCKGVEKHLNEK